MKPFSEIEAAWVEAWYRDGYTYDQLARAFHRNAKNLSRWLKQRGVPRHSQWVAGTPKNYLGRRRPMKRCEICGAPIRRVARFARPTTTVAAMRFCSQQCAYRSRSTPEGRLRLAKRMAPTTPPDLEAAILASHWDDRSRIAFARRLWTKFRLSVEEYARMWNRQGGQCPICRTVLRNGTGGAVVDHNHKTKQVRAILCCYCNRFVLGPAERAGHDRSVAAIEYLWGKLAL